MNRVFLGLGSNLGDRRVFISGAIKRLSEYPGLAISQCSSFYESEPVGYTLQNTFFNAVLEISYAFDPETLLDTVKEVECEMGRSGSFQWGPREIDIDILFFNAHICESRRLSIPHPELYKRRFVLEPLAEIAPDFLCPVTELSVKELLRICEDKSDVSIMI
ncbi:2-amino-4-hydroxy-6-hydroxymethyldihydropteridine diphosphokinase [candidate division KSB1 bacterium]